MGTNGQFGSIRKLPSGRYQVRYFHLGRRITADHTFPTKADARAFLAGVETDLKRGNYVDRSAGRITFGEYAGWWIEQRPLRPRTRETYDSQLKHLLRAFGPAQLTAISPADVRTWHGRLSQSELHPNPVAKIYRLLRTILGTAVDDGVLPPDSHLPRSRLGPEADAVLLPGPSGVGAYTLRSTLARRRRNQTYVHRGGGSDLSARRTGSRSHGRLQPAADPLG